MSRPLFERDGNVWIRMGGQERRARDLAAQDQVRWVLAAGLSAEALRALAQRIDDGIELQEMP